jgi:hypothetical protein
MMPPPLPLLHLTLQPFGNHPLTLQSDVRTTLGAWREYIHRAHILVVHAPGRINTELLLGDPQTLPRVPDQLGPHLKADTVYCLGTAPNDSCESHGQSSVVLKSDQLDGDTEVSSRTRGGSSGSLAGVLHCVLDQHDPRLKSVASNVGRATLAQALTVYRGMSTVWWAPPLPATSSSAVAANAAVSVSEP